MNRTQLDLQIQKAGRSNSSWGKILNTPSLLWGSIMFALLIGIAVFAPVISPYQPSDQNISATLQPPSFEHWLGTDQLGRDLFTRLIYAARTDLKIMVLAEIIPFCMGVFLGMLAGYYGKWVDTIITLLTDTFIAFPFYLIIILVSFARGICGP
ncbi:ABC transporter permease, partial [Paenibacillus sp. 28ISP30-2]|nr:ABC transporter permease [Paenibacillus sp. 28ISP30-2]